MFQAIRNIWKNEFFKNVATLISGTTLAFRELTWKFTKPVFIGDTIHVQVVVTETKKMARLGGGLVTFEARVVNQNEAVVHKGEWRMLMKGRD